MSSHDDSNIQVPRPTATVSLYDLRGQSPDPRSFYPIAVPRAEFPLYIKADDIFPQLVLAEMENRLETWSRKEDPYFDHLGDPPVELYRGLDPAQVDSSLPPTTTVIEADPSSYTLTEGEMKAMGDFSPGMPISGKLVYQFASALLRQKYSQGHRGTSLDILKSYFDASFAKSDFAVPTSAAVGEFLVSTNFVPDPSLAPLSGAVLMNSELRAIQMDVTAWGVADALATEQDYPVFEGYTCGHTTECWAIQLRNLRHIWADGCGVYLEELEARGDVPSFDRFDLEPRHFREEEMECICAGRNNAYCATVDHVGLVYKVVEDDD